MKKFEYWFYEKQTDDVIIGFRVKTPIYSTKTEYQRLDIVDTYEFGRVLFLDGTVQLTERDEFIYHEMIAHPPLNSLTSPKQVLIIGGGDGGTARECLKHNVESVTIVEIDPEVINASKKYFPNLSSAFKDSRLTVKVQDGVRFVKESEDKYDLIIVDSTDPVGPAKALFSKIFYKDAIRILKKGGIMITQSGTPFYYPEHLKTALKNISSVFNHTFTYCVTIPTYPGALWSFTMASDEQIKLKNKKGLETKYYSLQIHNNLCCPRFVENLISKFHRQ